MGSGVRFLVPFAFVHTNDCGPCRRVPRDTPRRGLARALPRDVARIVWREQRRVAIHGVREDEGLGIRAQAAARREARSCMDDGRREAGASAFPAART